MTLVKRIPLAVSTGLLLLWALWVVRDFRDRTKASDALWSASQRYIGEQRRTHPMTDAQAEEYAKRLYLEVYHSGPPRTWKYKTP